MKLFPSLALATVVTLGSTAVQAETTKVSLGISGWTGFAPLTLADKAGIFKAHGLDVEIKMIPQKDRHLAIASNAVQCAATTVETYVAWNANGVPIVQILQLDKSYGADGLAVRNNIKSFADLKGKTIGVDAPGTSPYFGLAYMLKKNGMSLKDVKLATLSPQASAQAFLAGQNDAAMTSELGSSGTGKRQDPGHHPQVPDGDGYPGLFSAVAAKEPQGRQSPG
jgi:NitT/TauT family transport system substrate-binding protein